MGKQSWINHIDTNVHIYRYTRLKALGTWLVSVYRMLLDTNTQTQATTACSKTHTETPTCPTEQPKQYIRLQVKRKREKIVSLEGKGGRHAPRDFLTHLLSGWQSWQWVWEAGQGVAWGGTAASLGSPHGLQRKQQVFWGAVAGLVWLKDLGTGGLQTHWQRDSLQTLRGQPHDTQKTLHKWSAGGADRRTQDRDVG